MRYSRGYEVNEVSGRTSRTKKARNDDFLEEIVAEGTARNTEFPALVDAALERRVLMRQLAERRERLGISQTEIAARMQTSQSAVARLEGGDMDARLSTVERLAAALGQRIEWRLSSDSAATRSSDRREVRRKIVRRPNR
jgi:ribosome-binding protein aMBF1 (putative translation factor)